MSNRNHSDKSPAVQFVNNAVGISGLVGTVLCGRQTFADGTSTLLWAGLTALCVLVTGFIVLGGGFLFTPEITNNPQNIGASNTSGRSVYIDLYPARDIPINLDDTRAVPDTGNISIDVDAKGRMVGVIVRDTTDPVNAALVPRDWMPRNPLRRRSLIRILDRLHTDKTIF